MWLNIVGTPKIIIRLMSTMCLPYHAHIESDMYQEDRKLDIPGPFSQLP